MPLNSRQRVRASKTVLGNKNAIEMQSEISCASKTV